MSRKDIEMALDGRNRLFNAVKMAFTELYGSPLYLPRGETQNAVIARIGLKKHGRLVRCVNEALLTHGFKQVYINGVRYYKNINKLGDGRTKIHSGADRGYQQDPRIPG
jgi:hypothetical protein